MFVVFGWVKEAQEMAGTADCYCYRCQRTRAWELWKETEWVSFFMIKTIPFLSKKFMVCGACREPIQISNSLASSFSMPVENVKIVKFLEEFQLAGKTEVQKNYLRAQREQRQEGDSNSF